MNSATKVPAYLTVKEQAFALEVEEQEVRTQYVLDDY